MSGELAIALAAAMILAAVAAAVIAVRTRRVVATPTERAVHAALQPRHWRPTRCAGDWTPRRRRRLHRFCAASPAPTA